MFLLFERRVTSFTLSTYCQVYYCNVCGLSSTKGILTQVCSTGTTVVPPPVEASFSGGICCSIEAGGSHGLELGCDLDVGYGTSTIGCGVQIPLGSNIIAHGLAHFIPKTLPIQIGTGFCCGVEYTASGNCELVCSGEAAAGHGYGGCSHGLNVYHAPCSTLSGAFTKLAVLPLLSQPGALPPTLCDQSALNCPVPCSDLPLNPNYIATLLGGNTKCASAVFGCCNGGIYCKPWCWVTI